MSDLTELYQEYAAGVTDAPPIYPQWMSYLVLSSVLNKNIYMRSGLGNIYPNFYFLVVGPSSTFRKSSSQRLAISIIREVVPDFPLFDVSSREAFISELARADRAPFGAGVIVIDEMLGFMARAKGSHHFSGMIQDLSTAFNNEPIERRVGVDEETKKVYRVNEPFLNMTATCSFDWLTKSVETSDLTGGFLARFIWVVASKKKDQPWPEAKVGDAMLRSRIVKELTELRNLVGEMSWSAEAKKLWDDWYPDFRTRNQGGKWDANYERLTTQARKIAMIHAAQQMRLVISADDLDRAISLVEPLIDSLNDICIGENKIEVTRNKIFNMINRSHPKPIKRSTLLNAIYGLDAREFKEHERTLLEMDKIESFLGDTHKGRRPMMYRLKEI